MYINLLSAVFVRPSLIKPPDNVTIQEHSVAQFQCHFNASTLGHLTITEWFKDEHTITNTSKYQVIPGTCLQKETAVCSILRILNVSESDEGNYSCHCYYNKTVLANYYIDNTVKAQPGHATLKLKGIYCKMFLI